MQNNTEWATIGKIAAPFGLRGELKVLLLSDIPNRFAQLASVHLGPNHILYRIKGVRPYKGTMVLLRLADVDDVDTAETLRALDIAIPASQLATLPSDSYYQHDIIGLHVVTLQGREVGTITDIIVTGGNDVYVVKGPDQQQILIPAIKDVVKQIDLTERIMHIDPMLGLLDDDAEVQSSDE